MPAEFLRTFKRVGFSATVPLAALLMAMALPTLLQDPRQRLGPADETA